MSTRRDFLGQGLQALGLLAWVGQTRLAAGQTGDAPGANSSVAESARKLTEKGVAFLRSRQDAKGGWSTEREPGITALAVAALLRSGLVAPADPAIIKALGYLEGFIGSKGGLSEAPHANYSTSIAMLAFKEANVNGRYDGIIKSAREFLKSMQWDEGEGKSQGRTPSTAVPATAAATAGPIFQTPRSSSKPCARPGCRPMTPIFKKHLSSCPDART